MEGGITGIEIDGGHRYVFMTYIFKGRTRYIMAHRKDGRKSGCFEGILGVFETVRLNFFGGSAEE